MNHSVSDRSVLRIYQSTVNRISMKHEAAISLSLLLLRAKLFHTAYIHIGLGQSRISLSVIVITEIYYSLFIVLLYTRSWYLVAGPSRLIIDNS